MKIKANIKINDHICFTFRLLSVFIQLFRKLYYYYQNKDSILNKVKIKKTFSMKIKVIDLQYLKTKLLLLEQQKKTFNTSN